MFENIKAKFVQAKEKLAEKAGQGMQRLQTTVDKIKDRWSVFSTETKAEIAVIVTPIAEKVKDTADVAFEAYSEGENLNMWQRLGNVAREATSRMREGVNTMRDRVTRMKNDLVERYSGMGIVGGAVQIVDDAMDKVAEFPQFVLDKMAQFEGDKIAYLEENSGKAIERDTQGGADLSDKTRDMLVSYLSAINHIAERRNNFVDLAYDQYAKVRLMREKRAQLAAGKTTPLASSLASA